VQRMTKKVMTLHPVKEGNGTDIYNNMCSMEKISREAKTNTHSSPQRAMVHQTELADGRLSLQMNSDSSHCRE